MLCHMGICSSQEREGSLCGVRRHATIILCTHEARAKHARSTPSNAILMQCNVMQSNDLGEDQDTGTVPSQRPTAEELELACIIDLVAASRICKVPAGFSDNESDNNTNVTRASVTVIAIDPGETPFVAQHGRVVCFRTSSTTIALFNSRHASPVKRFLAIAHRWRR